MKKLIVMFGILLVITPFIVVMVLSAKGNSESICDSIEFDRPPVSVSLFYVTPDNSNTLVSNQTGIFLPPDGDPVPYGCQYSQFHEYQKAAVFSDFTQLNECARMPPEIRAAFLNMDFRCHQVVIIHIIHGSDDKTEFRGHEIKGGSVEFCFRQRSPFRGGDDEGIPRQYIFLVNLCGTSGTPNP